MFGNEDEAISVIHEIDKKLHAKALEIAEFKMDDRVKLINPEGKLAVLVDNFIFTNGAEGRVVHPVVKLKNEDLSGIFTAMMRQEESDVKIDKYQVLMAINKDVAVIVEVKKEFIVLLTEEELKEKQRRYK